MAAHCFTRKATGRWPLGPSCGDESPLACRRSASTRSSRTSWACTGVSPRPSLTSTARCCWAPVRGRPLPRARRTGRWRSRPRRQTLLLNSRNQRGRPQTPRRSPRSKVGARPVAGWWSARAGVMIRNREKGRGTHACGRGSCGVVVCSVSNA